MKMINIEITKRRMKNFKDSAGFDLSADIDSIKTEEDASEVTIKP